MAEPSRPPSLPSTADEVAYAPVSWLAVGSVGVAGLFVVLLLGFGIDAVLKKKSLIMPELMLLAGIAVVLSFAARRVIRTSEGTRTGESLTNVAWWSAVVAGIVYGAYWMAIEYAIRRSAKEEVEKWVGAVIQGEVSPAFHRTLEPGRRVRINANDDAKMTAEFREPYLAFRQSDLLRFTRRYPNECEFVPGGLRDWVSKPKTIDCTFTGTVKTPEGAFPVHVPLKGVEGGADTGGVRQWQVVAPPSGFVQVERVTLTRYGWAVAMLETQAGGIGRQFISLSSAGPGAQPYAYHLFSRPGVNEDWQKLMSTSLPRAMAVGGLSAVLPYTADYAAFVNGPMLVQPNGKEPTTGQRADFLRAWNTTGLLPPGARLKNSPDTLDLMTFVRDDQKKIVRIESRVPVEIPILRSDTDTAAARGRLVVECTDPAALDLLNSLRATNADPNQPQLIPPEEFMKPTYKWRVARVESDLYPVSTPRGPGGPELPPPGSGAH